MKTKLDQPKALKQRAPRSLLGLCLLSVCLMLAGTGCKPGATASADINPLGSYTLVSVDGQKVPCTTTHEGHTMTIQSGRFTINGDRTCCSRITLAVPSRADMTVEVKATYTRQGAELTMQWEGAGMTLGNVKGDTFTMTNEGMVFAYSK